MTCVSQNDSKTDTRPIPESADSGTRIPERGFRKARIPERTESGKHGFRKARIPERGFQKRRLPET